MESKKEIRNQILKLRDSLGEEERMLKSRLIMNQVLGHPFFRESEEIYCYVDFRSEVMTKELIDRCWQAGKKVAVPKVTGAEMSFYYIHDFQELSPGYYGILEPTALRIAEAKEALVIMPGAVFDCICNRIGYGGGFYDRYLAAHKSYHSIQLAFELQRVEQVPAETHDLKPEVIITEEHVYEKLFTC